MQKSLTYLLYLIHPPQKLVINVQGKQVQVRVLGAIKTLGGNITQKVHNYKILTQKMYLLTWMQILMGSVIIFWSVVTSACV